MPALGGQIGGAVAAHLGKGTAADHQHKKEKMEQGGNNPGDRVGQIQADGGMVDGKYRGDPNQPQDTGAYDGSNHGDYRAAKSPQRAYQGLHNAADKISTADNLKPDHSLMHHIRFTGSIETDQRISQKINQISKDKAEEN